MPAVAERLPWTLRAYSGLASLATPLARIVLARRLKLGEVRLLDGEPDASLFDRIMEGIFGKLAERAPAH